jgi:hypothetical protein
VFLPQSFVGPITMTSHYGSIKRSPAIMADSTLFFESNGMQRGFIGDHTEWGTDPDNWKGDAAHIESHYGKVRVSFNEENDIPSKSPGASGERVGFFSKLFGSEFFHNQ